MKYLIQRNAKTFSQFFKRDLCSQIMKSFLYPIYLEKKTLWSLCQDSEKYLLDI